MPSIPGIIKSLRIKSKWPPEIRSSAWAGPQGQGSARRHGVARVGEQVEKYLPQFLSVGVNQRDGGGELRPHRHAALPQMVEHEFQGPLDLVPHVHGGHLVVAEPAEL